MGEQKIVRMHVTSDRESELGLIHSQGGQAVPLGTIETINGKQYRVIDNSNFGIVVTYEPLHNCHIVPNKPAGYRCTTHKRWVSVEQASKGFCDHE